MNPQAVVPALLDGDGAPLFQSLAILEYLDETHPEPPLLPKEPRARARVRGLAMITACDVHPLIVPRIRNYLANELKLDEPTKLKWLQHWFNEGSRAIESHLAGEKETGRFCHGDRGHARRRLRRLARGRREAASSATRRRSRRCTRIVDECLKLDAFARAHPLKQPGAQAAH